MTDKVGLQIPHVTRMNKFEEYLNKGVVISVYENLKELMLSTWKIKIICPLFDDKNDSFLKIPTMFLSTFRHLTLHVGWDNEFDSTCMSIFSFQKIISDYFKLSLDNAYIK